MLGLFLSEQKLNISDTMIVLPEMKTVEVQVGDSLRPTGKAYNIPNRKKGTIREKPSGSGNTSQVTARR